MMKPTRKIYTGYVSLGVAKRVVGIQDQVPHRRKQAKGNRARQDRRHHPAHDDVSHVSPFDRVDTDSGDREAHDGADDGVGCRHGPAEIGRNQEPDPRGKQRREHPVDEQIGVPRQQSHVDDPLAYGGRHLAAGQHRAAKLEHRSDDNRLSDGQGARANGRFPWHWRRRWPQCQRP